MLATNGCAGVSLLPEILIYVRSNVTPSGKPRAISVSLLQGQ
jgi:hypothetical protein